MPTLQQLEARAAKAKQKHKNKKPLESQVEKPVKDYARSKGFWVRKFKSMNNRSVPDDVLATPMGRVIFIEFKRPGKGPTDAQADEHKLMRDNKLEVFIIDNVVDGKKLIDHLLEQDWYL